MSTTKLNEKKSNRPTARGNEGNAAGRQSRPPVDRRQKSQEDRKVHYRDGCRLDVEPLRLNPENNWITFSDTMMVLAEKEYGALADVLKGIKVPRKPIPNFDAKKFADDHLDSRNLPLRSK